jgi:putative nucleotidyltransferase with HDIG domain
VSKLSLDDVVGRIADLPSLPATLVQVIDDCDDPDVTAGQLAQRILRDQHLTASILRLANSAVYGWSARITTVTDAVVLLGFPTIKSLAISSHTHRLLAGELDGYGMAKGELWRHSAAVAVLARRLAVEARLTPVEEAFVAGLLHDLGKTVLSAYLREDFEETMAVVQRERVSFAEAERRVVGFDHAELGARVAQAWNFPAPLVEAIRLHHAPAEAVIKPRLAQVVHLADAIALMLGVGLGADGLSYPIDSRTLAALGYDDVPRLTRLLDDVEPLLACDDFRLD